jgi:hypothetical protein
MTYKIIRASSEDQLENEINRYIRNGWVPVGGVAVFRFSAGTYEFFIQAIIKTETT